MEQSTGTIIINDLMTFLSFLEEEIKINEFTFMYTERKDGFVYFHVLEGKENTHRLCIDRTGIDNAVYLPPNMNKKNAYQIKRFIEWREKKRKGN